MYTVIVNTYIHICPSLSWYVISTKGSYLNIMYIFRKHLPTCILFYPADVSITSEKQKTLRTPLFPKQLYVSVHFYVFIKPNAFQAFLNENQIEIHFEPEI